MSQDQPLCPEEATLLTVGVQVAYDEEWVGELPNRHPVKNPDKIRSVFLPFKPEDWWELTTRDGEDYIGPCCGTTAAMQDILCSVYREGGWIDSDDLLELGALGESHKDGFEDWSKGLSEEQGKKALEHWDELPRWDRIGIIFRALRDRLRPGSGQELHVGKTEWQEKDVMWVLRNGLSILSYNDLFRGDKEDESKQDHANRLLSFARILPAMKMFMGALANYKPFEGVAIVATEKPEHVIDNRLGMCIYKTTEDAQKVIDTSAKKKGNKALFRVRPVRVSIEEGFVFTDSPIKPR